jgi:hypothetical protein
MYFNVDIEENMLCQNIHLKKGDKTVKCVIGA